ncbi:hypothetical protein B0H13DRAFT_2427734 [Mycena leptocephala]|nr:hypothetical protein B0H13DRAFT_2427734 [Mycena leptocephala]
MDRAHAPASRIQPALFICARIKTEPRIDALASTSGVQARGTILRTYSPAPQTHEHRRDLPDSTTPASHTPPRTSTDFHTDTDTASSLYPQPQSRPPRNASPRSSSLERITYSSGAVRVFPHTRTLLGLACIQSTRAPRKRDIGADVSSRSETSHATTHLPAGFMRAIAHPSTSGEHPARAIRGAWDVNGMYARPTILTRPPASLRTPTSHAPNEWQSNGYEDRRADAHPHPPRTRPDERQSLLRGSTPSSSSRTRLPTPTLKPTAAPSVKRRLRADALPPTGLADAYTLLPFSEEARIRPTPSQLPGAERAGETQENVPPAIATLNRHPGNSASSMFLWDGRVWKKRRGTNKAAHCISEASANTGVRNPPCCQLSTFLVLVHVRVLVRRIAGTSELLVLGLSSSLSGVPLIFILRIAIDDHDSGED